MCIPSVAAICYTNSLGSHYDCSFICAKQVSLNRVCLAIVLLAPTQGCCYFNRGCPNCVFDAYTRYIVVNIYLDVTHLCLLFLCQTILPFISCDPLVFFIPVPGYFNHLCPTYIFRSTPECCYFK